jgi:hypothetical protein
VVFDVADAAPHGSCGVLLGGAQFGAGGDQVYQRERAGAVRELADGRLDITGATVEQVATLAAARGLLIFEISQQAGTLEDAFLTLTAGERRPG